MNVKYEFRHVEGRIQMVVTVFMDEDNKIESYVDVTDDVMPVVDEYLDFHLGISDLKHTNGRISYEGKDKNRYKKS